MNEFRIITPDRQELLIVNALPEELKKFRLPGAESLTTKGDFGQMFFHHFKGKDFDIWYSNYLISQNVKLIGLSDDPLLEFHTLYWNQFSASMNGRKEGSVAKQYQLTHVPDVDTEVEFVAGKRYDTFDIHFYKKILEPYAEVCPRLAGFLDDVENRKASRLVNIVRILTEEMEQCIRDILTYSRHQQLTGRFYEGRVHDILILLVDHINLLDKHPYIDPVEQKKAEQVMKMILSDFTEYQIVEDLASAVNTTEAKLQLAFKQRYGMTVGRFSREARMKKAHEMLSKEDKLVWDVAMAVGYPDTGNFCTAFKSYFNYSPGHIHKKLKRQ